jgi:hypothetical protein
MEHDNCVAGSGCSPELDDVKIDSITCIQIPIFSAVREMLSVSR